MVPRSIIGANRRFANAKRSMLHPGKQPERRMHAVRTYIYPRWGAYFLILICCMYEGESTSRPSSTATTMQIIPKFPTRKTIFVPSHVIIFCLIGTPMHRSNGQKKKKNEQPSFSLSLVGRSPLSLPPRHRFGPGKAFLPLCHSSEPRRPTRAKPGAHRGPRSPARQS